MESLVGGSHEGQLLSDSAQTQALVAVSHDIDSRKPIDEMYAHVKSQKPPLKMKSSLVSVEPRMIELTST